MASRVKRVPVFIPSISELHFVNSWPPGTSYPVIALPVLGTVVSGDATNGAMWRLRHDGFGLLVALSEAVIAAYYNGPSRLKLSYGRRKTETGRLKREICMPNEIQHVFVLMLENRSFDHMLGFPGISGTDAVSGSPTSINGLTLAGSSLLQLARSWQRNSVSGIVLRQRGKWPPPPTVSIRALLTSSISNTFNGQSFTVTQPADWVMPIDPCHEFCRDLSNPFNKIPTGVLQQLCGAGAVYPFGGAYPPVLNTGFVASYAASGGQGDPGEIMKCYNPDRLPVLNQLAQEFVVCDNWYASMPGPTWPNRFFAHAASSGGLDHSPSGADIAKWDTVDGFSFANGTIFDRMNNKNIKWRLYGGDHFPIVAALKGVKLTDINHFADFASDVAKPDYPASYTFIEPDYGHSFSDFRCGTSQHPKDDVTRGESLIKATYEAVRNSPLWSGSMIIITWDEHGGFYDHVPPPSAVAPGDTVPGGDYNQYGFTFQQYGPRVPAVIISPLIPGNLIDHRVYDHASIPATLEVCFSLSAMTQRDAGANNLMPLVSLSSPRGDTPTVLKMPAQSGVTGCDPVSFQRRAATTAPDETVILPVTRPDDSIDEGNMPGFMFVVLRSDLAVSAPGDRPAIIGRFNTIRTRSDASQYMEEVRVKVRLARNASSG
jgi:phospholipase C